MGIYEIKKPKKINSFSVTIFFVAIVSAYLCYWYIPIWWPTFQIGGIMKGICNDAYRQPNNETLMDTLVKQTARTGLKLTKENFTLVRVPYDPKDLPSEPSTREVFERRGKLCRLTFNYRNIYALPFTGKSVPLTFSKTIETDLKVVTY